MAYASNSDLRTAPVSGGFVATLIAVFRETLQRRKVYNTTVRELNALSARELADLGISRCAIERIAVEAAFDKKAI